MSHLKRLNAPRMWNVKRKITKYIIRPNPGSHSKTRSVPLGVVFRDYMEYCRTLKEVKHLLYNKTVSVDGIRRKDPKFPVGLFDVITIKETNQSFRIIYDNKKIDILEIDKKESSLKLCKITGKNKIGKKTQLNMNDGRNLLIDKDEYNVGDSVLLSVPENKIKEHVKFEKGITIYLIGGKHLGHVGSLQAISQNKIQFKTKEGSFETLKKYAFGVGKDKPIINLTKK